jgi:hypothetical protein
MTRFRYFPNFESPRDWLLLLFVIVGIGLSVILLSKIFYWGILIYPAILLITSIVLPLFVSRGGFFFSSFFSIGLFVSATFLGEPSESICFTELIILVMIPILISLIVATWRWRVKIIPNA